MCGKLLNLFFKHFNDLNSFSYVCSWSGIWESWGVQTLLHNSHSLYFKNFTKIRITKEYTEFQLHKREHFYWLPKSVKVKTLIQGPYSDHSRLLLFSIFVITVDYKSESNIVCYRIFSDFSLLWLQLYDEVRKKSPRLPSLHSQFLNQREVTMREIEVRWKVQEPPISSQTQKKNETSQ